MYPRFWWDRNEHLYNLGLPAWYYMCEIKNFGFWKKLPFSVLFRKKH